MTGERWTHIEARHPELRGSRERVLEAVSNPDLVVRGRYGEMLAARPSGITGVPKFLVVVYREAGKDGFIITAFLTSDIADLKRREKVWPSLF